MVLPQWLARVTGAPAGRQAKEVLLSPAEFEHAATCERMRVDRNGSILSILLIQLSDNQHQNAELAKLLDERLRLTDTAGLLRDGRVGVLLPDTPLDGAWKVADDLGKELQESGSKPSFEVMIYPDGGGGSGQTWADDAPGGAQPVAVPAAENESVTAYRSAEFDAVFAKATPLWKRATDVVIGGIGLAVATPVVAACAGAVVLTSRGAPFFAQEREGVGGRRFKIYKIRTMHTDAEQRKAQLREQSEQDGPAFKMTHDPRVTRIGRVLRALSIDELPQLLNVVRGDMSLVGPRPLPVDESQQCKPWQRQRLQVKPGITCIWQVRGRNIVPFDDWIRMDLQYIKRRSPLHDMRLLLETGPSLIFSRGPR